MCMLPDPWVDLPTETNAEPAESASPDPRAMSPPSEEEPVVIDASPEAATSADPLAMCVLPPASSFESPAERDTDPPRPADLPAVNEIEPAAAASLDEMLNDPVDVTAAEDDTDSGPD